LPLSFESTKLIKFGVSEQKRQELEQQMHSCGLLEQDLEEKFVRSSGPGGQRVNKTATCVQLTHLPTGLSVKIQKSRSQGLNRFYARRQLCELLENEQMGLNSPEAKRIQKIRKQKDRKRRRNKSE